MIIVTRKESNTEYQEWRCSEFGLNAMSLSLALQAPLQEIKYNHVDGVMMMVMMMMMAMVMMIFNLQYLV